MSTDPAQSLQQQATIDLKIALAAAVVTAPGLALPSPTSENIPGQKPQFVHGADDRTLHPSLASYAAATDKIQKVTQDVIPQLFAQELEQQMKMRGEPTPMQEDMRSQKRSAESKDESTKKVERRDDTVDKSGLNKGPGTG